METSRCAKRKALSRALRLARIIVATDYSFRYSVEKKVDSKNRLYEAVRNVSVLHGMQQDRANDQIVMRAYSLPLLRAKMGSW